MSKLQELLRRADAYKEIIQKSGVPAETYINSEFKTADITEDFIRNLHRSVYNGTDSSQAGRYRTSAAADPSESPILPSPKDLPRLMSHLENQIYSSKSALHPVELAAMAHKRLLDIHPFADGNEKTAEILRDVILSRSGYCPVSVPSGRKKEFADTLASSRKSSDMEPLSILTAQLVIKAQEDYIRKHQISLTE
ncbi:Fic family protein [Anaerostipes sp.]|uniref:Fic family protein n=1 Tax=Anaerostipes sp. TaxID=1872530 RepID=UPI0025B8C445|nr:Fic family protein [Anaerostipes sp.]MBS7007406.1 Fic family protein [Anaerostipes sp.]